MHACEVCLLSQCSLFSSRDDLEVDEGDEELDEGNEEVDEGDEQVDRAETNHGDGSLTGAGDGPSNTDIINLVKDENPKVEQSQVPVGEQLPNQGSSSLLLLVTCFIFYHAV